MEFRRSTRLRELHEVEEFIEDDDNESDHDIEDDGIDYESHDDGVMATKEDDEEEDPPATLSDLSSTYNLFIIAQDLILLAIGVAEPCYLSTYIYLCR